LSRFFFSLSLPFFPSRFRIKPKKYDGINWSESASHVSHQVGVSADLVEEPEAKAEEEVVAVEAEPVAEPTAEPAEEAAPEAEAEAAPEEKKVSVSEDSGTATRSRSRSKSKKRKEEVGGGPDSFFSGETLPKGIAQYR
jgi:hypothetical protein